MQCIYVGLHRQTGTTCVFTYSTGPILMPFHLYLSQSHFTSQSHVSSAGHVHRQTSICLHLYARISKSRHAVFGRSYARMQTATPLQLGQPGLHLLTAMASGESLAGKFVRLDPVKYEIEIEIEISLENVCGGSVCTCRFDTRKRFYAYFIRGP